MQMQLPARYLRALARDMCARALQRHITPELSYDARCEVALSALKLYLKATGDDDIVETVDRLLNQ